MPFATPGSLEAAVLDTPDRAALERLLVDIVGGEHDAWLPGLAEAEASGRRRHIVSRVIELRAQVCSEAHRG